MLPYIFVNKKILDRKNDIGINEFKNLLIQEFDSNFDDFKIQDYYNLCDKLKYDISYDLFKKISKIVYSDHIKKFNNEELLNIGIIRETKDFKSFS